MVEQLQLNLPNLRGSIVRHRRAVRSVRGRVGPWGRRGATFFRVPSPDPTQRARAPRDGSLISVISLIPIPQFTIVRGLL